MNVALRLLVVVALLVQVPSSQTAKPITVAPREPGIYELASLFRIADKVVLAKIVARDMESYGVAIYKTEVLKNFKGSAKGETVYFGPFVGERLGSEYILFLRDVTKPITPKRTASTGYGSIRYSEIFNEGYTAMENSYECVF